MRYLTIFQMTLRKDNILGKMITTKQTPKTKQKNHFIN